MTRLTADLLLLFTAAIWGLAFVFQKTAMELVGPFTFIAARATVATLALIPVAMYEARRAARPTAPSRDFKHRGLIKAGVVAGLAFFAGAALQQFGLKTASATNGGFLTALYVVLVPVLAWFILGRQPGIYLVPAVILSFAGTWLLGGGSIEALSDGDQLIAACAIFWALHVILCERASAFARPAYFTALQFATVAVLGAVGAFVFETPTGSALWSAKGEILYVGLLSSAFTFTVLTIALSYTRASEAAVIVSTESLFAAIAGAILLTERLSTVAWTGAAMIVAATLIVQLAPRAPAESRTV